MLVRSSSLEPSSGGIAPRRQRGAPLRAAPLSAAPATATAAPSTAAFAAQRRQLPEPKAFPSSPPRFSATCAGAPEPLGPSPTAAGVNFAVYAPRASRVELVLHGGRDGPERGP